MRKGGEFTGSSIWWAGGGGGWRNPSLRSVKGLKSQLTDASWAVKRTGNHTCFVIYS